MRSVHKKSITILFIILLFLLCGSSYKIKASSNKKGSYLVLIQQKNGSWKKYTNLIEISKGIVCFSKYKDIPESVPIVKKKSTKETVPTPEPEPPSVTIEGVEFPVRTDFLSKGKALSDWGGTTILWSELEQKVDSKIIKSTNLWFNSNKIEFSHLAVGGNGVSLTKAKKDYRLSISVKLDGSVIADQNASIVKAMVTTISSKPSFVYEAIFESFTSSETHGINEDTYVNIGDCKLKVKVKDGIVTYYIRELK